MTLCLLPWTSSSSREGLIDPVKKRQKQKKKKKKWQSLIQFSSTEMTKLKGQLGRKCSSYQFVIVRHLISAVSNFGGSIKLILAVMIYHSCR